MYTQRVRARVEILTCYLYLRFEVPIHFSRNSQVLKALKIEDHHDIKFYIYRDAHADACKSLGSNRIWIHNASALLNEIFVKYSCNRTPNVVPVLHYNQSGLTF